MSRSLGQGQGHRIKNGVYKRNYIHTFASGPPTIETLKGNLVSKSIDIIDYNTELNIIKLVIEITLKVFLLKQCLSFRPP